MWRKRLAYKVCNSLSSSFIPLTLNIKSNVLLKVEYTDLGLNKGVNLYNGHFYYLIIICNSYSKQLSLNFVFNGVYSFY